jgi:hypothetical protein
VFDLCQTDRTDLWHSRKTVTLRIHPHAPSCAQIARSGVLLRAHRRAITRGGGVSPNAGSGRRNPAQDLRASPVLALRRPWFGLCARVAISMWMNERVSPTEGTIADCMHFVLVLRYFWGVNCGGWLFVEGCSQHVGTVPYGQGQGGWR